MKKSTWMIILLFITILSAAIIYNVPENIVREYDGIIYSYKNADIREPVKIILHGKLQRKIFGDDVFTGQMQINDQEIPIASPIPGNLNIMLQGLKDKLNRKSIFTTSAVPVNGIVKTQGVFQLARDFNYIIGYTISIREKYNSDDVLIVCPAHNSDDAEEVLRDKSIWDN